MTEATDTPSIEPARIALDNVSVVFRSGGALSRDHTVALRDVRLALPPGKTLGLVGESGSGKSTLGETLVGLVKPATGKVTVDERPSGRQRPGFHQLVGQNPNWTLNPRLRVWRSVAEPLAIAGRPRRQRRPAAVRMLRAVGLPGDLADRYPHQLSGGQLQRAAIARALVSEPGLVVFDEAVSALDVSVQVQIINVIRDLQARLGFTALFISHDLASVRYAADEVAVLYRGMLMNVAPAESFYGQAAHPYALALRSAETEDQAVALHDDVDVTDPAAGAADRPEPDGCPLARRCPFAVERCAVERPALAQVGSQRSACHRAAELADAADPRRLVTRPAAEQHTRPAVERQ